MAYKVKMCPRQECASAAKCISVACSSRAYIKPEQPAQQEPDCPKCGNNRQVWDNQITGKKTCHRVGCHQEIEQPAQQHEPVMCPFPCGWKRLFEIIIADGAFLARSLEEDEAITAHQREVVMRLIDYAKTMALHGMNTYPPPSKPWVGLTDEERMDVLLALNWDKQLTHMDTAKSIEAKLREKNHG